jgi:hypothetical protein
MSEWKEGNAPEDGRKFFAYWRGDSQVKVVRKVWIDEKGYPYNAPDYWREMDFPPQVVK